MATHPVQVKGNYHAKAEISTAVTLKAYEVYRHIHGKQEALVTGCCRGGFGAGELIAFLYAASFPKAEWRQRADEAFDEMKGL